MKRSPLFIANWKMNKNQQQVSAFCEEFLPKILEILSKESSAEVGIAPQFAHLDLLQRCLLGKPIQVLAQNCGTAQQGAFTGEVSPSALKEFGVGSVLLGHSERRHVFGEDVKQIDTRMRAALEQKLKIVLCVGETLQERKAGQTMNVVKAMLECLKGQEVLKGRLADHVVIAYEPVWAIGTGETATPEQAQEVHEGIRTLLEEWFGKELSQKVRILYGGSVKPENSRALMQQSDVDGLLVGNASLDSASFASLVQNGLSFQP